jgi:choline dehydrogenase-like flavoprotein
VLATGGLENARILLLAGRGQPKLFGNGAGLVGRYFMDHPNFVLGVLVPTRLALGAWAAYDLQYVDGYPVREDRVLSDSVLREEPLANATLHLTARPKWRDSAAVRAAAQLASSVRRRRRPSTGMGVLRDVLTHPNELMAAAWYQGVRRVPRLWESPWGWSRAPRYAGVFDGFTVRAQTEQLPDPSNRVALADDLDPFGLPRLRVEWRLNEPDLMSVARLAQIVANEVERSRVGVFIPAINERGGEHPPFKTSHHHLGTTRMHDDPARGVVNARCRVHGTTNLYVAGSSVFPTGAGYTNPTLTIVALALRLADHLQDELRG